MIGYVPPDDAARMVPETATAAPPPLPVDKPAPFAGTPEQQRITESTKVLRGFLALNAFFGLLIVGVGAVVVTFQAISTPFVQTLEHFAGLGGLALVIWGIRQTRRGLEQGQYSALTLVIVLMALSLVDNAWNNTSTVRTIIPAILVTITAWTWLGVSRARFAARLGTDGQRRRPFYLRGGVAFFALFVGWLTLAALHLDGQAAHSGEVLTPAAPFGPRLQFAYASRQSLNPFPGQRVMTIVVWRQKAEPPQLERSQAQQKADNWDFDAKAFALQRQGKELVVGPGNALLIRDPKNHALRIGDQSVVVPHLGRAVVVLVETSGWPTRSKIVGTTSVPAPLTSDVQTADDFRTLLRKSPSAAAFIR